MDLHKRLKQHAMKSRLARMIIYFVLAAVFIALAIGSYLAKTKNLPSLMSTPSGALSEGDWYEIRLDYILGGYAEDSKGVCYITATESDGKFLGVYVPSKKVDTADEIMENTWAYLNEEADDWGDLAINGRGKLRAMDSTEKTYFIEWFTDLGFERSEITDQLVYLTLDLAEGQNATRETILYGVVGLILLALGLGALIPLCTGRYKKDVVSVMERHALSPEVVEEDLTEPYKTRQAEFGRHYALIYLSKQKLIDYRDLIWVYKQTHTTRHKIYGIIPAGTTVTHSVILSTKDHAQVQTAVRNEEEADEVIRYLMNYAPRAIYGYTEELAQAYKERFDEMVAAVKSRSMAGEG